MMLSRGKSQHLIEVYIMDKIDRARFILSKKYTNIIIINIIK